MNQLERAARQQLLRSFGAGAPAATGLAPGRCTLVGEHVDYADGVVVCMAIDLAVAVAVRPSSDGRWRVSSAGRLVERAGRDPAGDIGDRVFAAATALEMHGVALPALDIAVAATLPEGAGLSSSAALICAALVAMLRWSASTVKAAELARIALETERDIVGVPCGPLDQRTVVLAPGDGVLLLDCRLDTYDTVPWNLTGTVIVACDTGAPHDVGGAGYRTRREQAASALLGIGAGSYRLVSVGDVEAAGLDELLTRRARHIVTETTRARRAAAALRDGDAGALGRLMSASHVSLRDDYSVSTALLDACVAAAMTVPDCHGARMVGAGFGGTAIALVASSSAAACGAAMAAAIGGGGRDGGTVRSWVLSPCAGVASLAPDVVR